MSENRLSLADQTLVNIGGYLAVQVIHDANTDVALAVLAEVLPHVTRTHPLIAALAEAGGAVHSAGAMRGRPGPAWCSAQLELRRALAAFFFWRGGGALEAWRATVVSETPDLFAKEPA